MITDHAAGTLSDLDRRVVTAVPPGGNWRDIPIDIPSKRLDQIRRGARLGLGSRSTYYGRLTWDEPAYTISTYFSRPGNGCFIHPEVDRLITLREAARLQSFPDSYAFAGSFRSRAMQIGNAVPPLLAYQLASVLPRGTAVDLFCGAGGLSLGFEMAGALTIAAIDHDANSLSSFQRNSERPVAVQGDLSTESGLERAVAEVRGRLSGVDLDLLLGGPPCQGFSTAGKYLKDDPRNRLVWNFLEAVAQLEPRVVVIENVPALMWGRARGTLEAIMDRLRELGYACDARLLHAEGYGVGQRRRRLFIIGAQPGTEIAWPAPQFRISQPHQMKLQPPGLGPLRPAPTVREWIGDLPAEASAIDVEVAYASEPLNIFQSWARGASSIHRIVHDAARVGATAVQTRLAEASA